MELNESLLADIAIIFKSVQYGRVTFFLSPEKDTLDYKVETSGKLHIGHDKKNSKKRLTKTITKRTVKLQTV